MKFNLLWLATKQLRLSFWLYYKLFDLGQALHVYGKYGKRPSRVEVEEISPYFHDRNGYYGMSYKNDRAKNREKYNDNAPGLLFKDDPNEDLPSIVGTIPQK